MSRTRRAPGFPEHCDGFLRFEPAQMSSSRNADLRRSAILVKIANGRDIVAPVIAVNISWPGGQFIDFTDLQFCECTRLRQPWWVVDRLVSAVLASLTEISSVPACWFTNEQADYSTIQVSTRLSAIETHGAVLGDGASMDNHHIFKCTLGGRKLPTGAENGLLLRASMTPRKGLEGDSCHQRSAS